MELLTAGLNILAALGTIGFGLFGWLKPNDTLSFLGLQPADSTGLGKSEVRAASGALWVFVGLGAMVIGTPTAYLMLGLVYVGAAVGRLTAILVDKATSGKPLMFFAVEATFAAVLVAINLPALIALQ
jgi:hypothetical protein